MVLGATLGGMFLCGVNNLKPIFVAPECRCPKFYSPLENKHINHIGTI